MIHVLILAGGLGTRLRPLSLSIPKPLVPVVDMSILAHQLRFVDSVSHKDLHINAFYMASLLKAEAQRLNIPNVWVETPKILGTAGPLYRLFKAGIEGDLLVMNSDCYHQMDMHSFVRNAKNSSAPISLLGVDRPEINILQVKSSLLSGVQGVFGEPSMEKLTFSGIAFYKNSVLNQILEEDFSIVSFWKRFIQEGGEIAVDQTQKNAIWIDMGTPKGFMQANLARLKEMKLNHWIDKKHPLYPKENDFDQSIVHLDTQIAEGAKLKNVVLLKGAQVLEGEYVENQIRGENFFWEV